MLSKIFITFIALFMPLVTAFNGISFTVPMMSDSAEIVYDFSNEESGSAAGTVTVKANLGGTYDLYWGTEDGEKLSEEVGDYTVYYSEFAEVSVKNGEGSADIQQFTAIPEGAETVLAYKGTILVGEYEIPDEKVTDFGEMVYSFGALSDVHFKRYNLSLTGDDAMITLPNALVNFFDELDVTMVGISGDISCDGEVESFEKFNSITSNFDFPVYTCTGNHDVNDEFTLKNWQANINAGVYGEEKLAGVQDVADNGLDFVYIPEGCEDVFVFLSQYQWDYNRPESRLLTDAQLDWLETQFAKYADKTVYLFFHTFLNNPVEGENIYMGEGNLENNVGQHYGIPFTEDCPDEIRFEQLMDEYENVVYFNGHSHWAYDMQELNPNLNIADYNGEYATMVHISSVSSPRRTKPNLDDTTEHYMRSSEGMLVEVYEDKIVFTACEFLKGEYLSYATYVINK